MKDKLTFEAFYPHPPERVWKALTDPKALSRWLMPTNLVPRIGFRFRFEEGAMQVTGEVLAVEEGKSLTYTWEDGESGEPSMVTWSLHPKDGGTELRLEHEVLEPEAPYVLIEASANWRHLMHGALPALLGRPPVPIVFVADEEDVPPKLARAGFRQEVMS